MSKDKEYTELTKGIVLEYPPFYSRPPIYRLTDSRSLVMAALRVYYLQVLAKRAHNGRMQIPEKTAVIGGDPDGPEGSEFKNKKRIEILVKFRRNFVEIFANFLQTCEKFRQVFIEILVQSGAKG